MNLWENCAIIAKRPEIFDFSPFFRLWQDGREAVCGSAGLGRVPACFCSIQNIGIFQGAGSALFWRDYGIEETGLRQ